MMMAHDDDDVKDADADVSKHVDDAFEAEYEDEEEGGFESTQNAFGDDHE
jgi:hypothetical protein